MNKLQLALDLMASLMTRHGLGKEWECGLDRARKRAGCCKFYVGGGGVITLSKFFCLNNSEADITDTILHEIAHALVGPQHGHDSVWQAAARRIGAKPERCYGDNIKMPAGKWAARCGGCQKTFHRHKRPRSLTGWSCRACGPTRGALIWQERA